jgi:hypothetical protein
MHFRQQFSRAMNSDQPVTVNSAPTRVAHLRRSDTGGWRDGAARNLHDFKTTVWIAWPG